jgi:hypothetical protein
MKYSKELVKQWAGEIYNTAKQSTTCSYVIRYSDVDSFDPTDKECRQDVREHIFDYYDLEDNLQGIDFNDVSQCIIIMWYEPPTKEEIEEENQTMYCVDLRSKITYDSVLTIFKTDSHDRAWDVANNYNKIHGNTEDELAMLEDAETEGWTPHPYWATVYNDYDEVIEPKFEEVKEMKKYTLANYKEFCEKALICPPFEDEENWQKWIDEHKIQIIANDCIMELDYDADAINEIEFSLREIYNAIFGDGTATTGNTIGSEYRNATWKDILRFSVLNQCYNTSNSLKYCVQDCISRFSRAEFEKTIKAINEQTSINDELEVNFFKLDTKDLWKIFDEEERERAFRGMLCQNIDIDELVGQDGKSADKTVITDYSIKPSGDLVGWHYGVDFDKYSEDNQCYINKYIEEMIG